MTRAKYIAETNELQELPDLDPPPDKPIENNYWGNVMQFHRDMQIWKRVMDNYNANAQKVEAICRTIPCSPECRGVFEVGKVYEEGKDYEVQLGPPDEWQPTYNNPDDPPVTAMAFPLPVKGEQGEDELWAEALSFLVNNPALNYPSQIKELKSRFIITKR